MSTNGNLEDLKLLRIQVMEDVGADDQIWVYQEGCIKCRVSIQGCTRKCIKCKMNIQGCTGNMHQTQGKHSGLHKKMHQMQDEHSGLHRQFPESFQK